MLLLDCLYDINRKLGLDTSVWERLQMKRLARGGVALLTNRLLPVFLRNSGETLRNGERLPVIVSLTSFPDRIGRVWMTVESMLCQSHKPEAVILWLSRTQFPAEEADLPDSLLRQRERGLSIRFVDDDIRSYKKFYYAFREFDKQFLLTIDDDLLFPSYFLKSIYDCKLQHPGDVIASFGFRFRWDETIGYIRVEDRKVEAGDSGNDLFFGSGGGTLLDTAVAKHMDAIETIRTLCPTADDIYLNALIRIGGFGVTFHMNNPLLSVTSRTDSKLVTHNGDIGDPHSVNAGQLKALAAHLRARFRTNPFIV